MMRFAGLEAKRMASSTYNPRHDPDIFDIVTGHLRRHSGEWVHIEDVFNIDPWLAREIVHAARHIGDVIVTRGQGKPGYKYIGCSRQRWVRAANVWPPRAPRCDEESGPLEGQLSLERAKG